MMRRSLQFKRARRERKFLRTDPIRQNRSQLSCVRQTRINPN
jgi:hypothetical protein